MHAGVCAAKAQKLIFCTQFKSILASNVRSTSKPVMPTLTAMASEATVTLTPACGATTDVLMLNKMSNCGAGTYTAGTTSLLYKVPPPMTSWILSWYGSALVLLTKSLVIELMPDAPTL